MKVICDIFNLKTNKIKIYDSNKKIQYNNNYIIL